MGHRYGSRGLPTTIFSAEYELLKDEMKTNPNLNLNFKFESSVCKIDQEDIVDYCYQMDENEIPFHYRLKNINKIIPGYIQKVRNFFRSYALFLTWIQSISFFCSIFEIRIQNMYKFGKKLKKN